MTDVPGTETTIAGRLGVLTRFVDGELELDLFPQPGTLHHGVIRASVLSFVIDIVAGIPVDQDHTMWTLTSDMSVRMRPIPAPPRIVATYAILRQGRRSATCSVEMSTGGGIPIGTGAIGFAKVPRKPGDPPKNPIPFGETHPTFRHLTDLTQPVRDEAGIRVLDASEGVVEVEVTADLRNPAGTMGGAMVALLAEAAAEEFMEARFQSPFVVTGLDLRYLRRAEVGPVRTRATLLGEGTDAPLRIELVDTTTDQITTLVYATAVAVPSS